MSVERDRRCVQDELAAWTPWCATRIRLAKDLLLPAWCERAKRWLVERLVELPEYKLDHGWDPPRDHSGIPRETGRRALDVYLECTFEEALEALNGQQSPSYQSGCGLYPDTLEREIDHAIRYPFMNAVAVAAAAALGDASDAHLAEFAALAERVAAENPDVLNTRSVQPPAVAVLEYDGGSLFGAEVEEAWIDAEFAVTETLKDEPVAPMVTRWNALAEHRLADRRERAGREARERAGRKAHLRELAELAEPGYRRRVGPGKREWRDRELVEDALRELAEQHGAQIVGAFVVSRSQLWSNKLHAHLNARWPAPS